MKKGIFFIIGIFFIFTLSAIPFLLDPWKNIKLNDRHFGFKEKNFGFVVTTGGYPCYTYYDYQKDSIPDKRIVQVLAGPGWVSMVAEVNMTYSDTATFKKILEIN